MADHLSIAEAIIKQMQDNYRFFRAYWHEYSGGVWRPVEDIYPVMEPTLKEWRNDFKVTSGLVGSVEFFLKKKLAIWDSSIIDNIGNYLNFRNGMLNLDTMELEKHDRDKLLTTQLDFDYENGDGDCPAFERFLQQVLCHPGGATDWEMLALMQELIGYSLSADRTRRISVWLWGDSNTGKSTLINALISILKPLQASVDLNQLGSNEYLLTRVPGKRLLTWTECDVGLKLNVGAYKTLVSSDEVTINVKYRDPISFVPSCIVWWAMNHTPSLSDRTEATFNRLMLVPMNAQISAEARDYGLIDKLVAERTKIVSWALQGYQRYKRQGGFSKCQQVDAAVKSFREEIDIYSDFLNDGEYVERVGEVKALELYQAYKGWAEERGIKNIPTIKQIAKEWRRLGLTMKISGGRYWQGIRVKYGSGKR